jgi:uncharacterized protein (TIGR02284 family)
MTPKHEPTVGPESLEDTDILNDVISVCRGGEALYSRAAAQVEDQHLRNMLSDMARVRSSIVNELAVDVGPTQVKPERSGAMIDDILCWYWDAQGSTTDYQDNGFIMQLERVETRALTLLRSAVSKLNNRALAFRLSSLVASLQISHDRMKLQKHSYSQWLECKEHFAKPSN